MNIVDFSEQEIEITAVYFRADHTNQVTVTSFPKRMVLSGREYTFSSDSLRYRVQRGRELIQLFDVSDEHTQYRLRLEPSRRWTLVGMKAKKAVEHAA